MIYPSEMQKGAVMGMRAAVEQSISAAIAAGTVDAKEHAAMIQAVRDLADRAERNDPERDNVTYPTLLKYLTAMGMTPVVERSKQDGRPASSLAAARKNAKFSKFHVA